VNKRWSFLLRFLCKTSHPKGKENPTSIKLQSCYMQSIQKPIESQTCAIQQEIALPCSRLTSHRKETHKWYHIERNWEHWNQRREHMNGGIVKQAMPLVSTFFFLNEVQERSLWYWNTLCYHDTSRWPRIPYPIRIGYWYSTDTPGIHIHHISAYWAVLGLETQLWIRIRCRISPSAQLHVNLYTSVPAPP
jgi:hypothetical protein